MSKLISLAEGDPSCNWFGTSGLFDWIVGFLRSRVTDPAVSEQMRRDAIAGYLFVGRLPPSSRAEVLRALRNELTTAVDTELYPMPYRRNNGQFADRVKQLATMAVRLAEQESSVAPAAPEPAADK
ncbi:hypothetical protein EDD99_3930 [Streptomyces sp. 846.5]|nr:hypothetical protein [Streptomyces sp. 846.5]TDU05418.1 hypothetical protein EDD99_3930 [Streptomyces sp. 846.5]